MNLSYLEHQFVEHLPDHLQEGILYISLKYATAGHCCACGCGKEVITPFSPTDWKMIFDGETITLSPSIGNWNFSCRSHYFIRHNQIVHASSWNTGQIIASRLEDKASKTAYYKNLNGTSGRILNRKALLQRTPKKRRALAQKLLYSFRSAWVILCSATYLK